MVSSCPLNPSRGTLQGRQRRPGEERRGGREDEQRTLPIAGRRWRRRREDLRWTCSPKSLVPGKSEKEWVGCVY